MKMKMEMEMEMDMDGNGSGSGNGSGNGSGSGSGSGSGRKQKQKRINAFLLFFVNGNDHEVEQVLGKCKVPNHTYFYSFIPYCFLLWCFSMLIRAKYLFMGWNCSQISQVTQH
jgi:hypothetical protein